MVLTVSVIFAICWSADAILHLLERFYFHKNLPLARSIIHAMLAFNAAVNPFAYALINKRFRGKIKEILSSSLCSPAQGVLSFDINMTNAIHQENRNRDHTLMVSTSPLTDLPVN